MSDIKTVPVINYSYATAQRNHTTEEWLACRKENSECAEEIIRQTKNNYNDFAATMDYILKSFSKERVQNVLVNEIFPDQETINYFEDNDRHIFSEISVDAARWARDIIVDAVENGGWDETLFADAPAIRDALSLNAISTMVEIYSRREKQQAEQDFMRSLNVGIDR